MSYGATQAQIMYTNQQQNGYPGAHNQPQVRAPRTVYYTQFSTKNKSFLVMHKYLESIGIKNNKFMLALIDPDLDGINPHDPSLNAVYKAKIHRECMSNYW